MTKLLLVEDDLMNREMLCRYLTLEGYEVVTATDGAQALALALSDPPDLILMDMGLPVLSGWQATQQLKAATQTCAIPVIALTAYAMAEDQARAFTVGCDDYETKPVNFARLREKIHTLLDASARGKTA
jgi:CheY-like chemotaxis protein